MTIKPEIATRMARRFGIPVEEIHWYNGGFCYDRLIVTTKTAADRVSAVVKDRRANGGWFNGMPLGGQNQFKAKDGTLMYEVTC